MKTRNEIIDELKKILIDQLNLDRTPESITEDTLLFGFGPGQQTLEKSPDDPDSLDLDSIDSLEIIIALEKYFDVKVTDEDLAAPEKIFKSIGTLADFVVSRLGNK
jgi:acyl carrier protein